VQFVTHKVMSLFCSRPDGSLIGVQLLWSKTISDELEIKHPIWVSVLLTTSRLALKVSREVKVPDKFKLQLLGITSTFTGGPDLLPLSYSVVNVQKYMLPFHQCITSLQLAVQLQTTFSPLHTEGCGIQFKLARPLTLLSPVRYRIMVAMSQMVAMTSSTIYSLLVLSLEDLHWVMQMVRKSETCDLHGSFKEAFKNLQCTLPHTHLVSILAIRLLCVEGNKGTKETGIYPTQILCSN